MNIPYTRSDMYPEDIAAVTYALNSGMLTNGKEISSFETEFRNTTEAPHAIAVSSGTAGLHLAVHALGVKPEQAVIVPSLTFAATANAVLYNHAKVEFVDIDPDTLLIDTDVIADKIQADPNRYAGVISVDFAGYPVDTRELFEVCHQHDAWLIKDTAHSLGAIANYGNQSVPAGSSRYADASVFSFHPAKHITTGEGGMITTSSSDLAQNLRLLRSHAMERGVGSDSQKEPWAYQINQLGYNYRMSDINASLGRSQLSRLDTNIAQRQLIAETYRNAFKGSAVQMPNYDDQHTNAYHLFIARVDNRKDVYLQLKDAGIFAQVHYVPLHMQPFYQDMDSDTALIHTEKYYSECLSLPMFQSLSESDQEYVIETMLVITSKK